MTPRHPFSTVTPKTLEAIEGAVTDGVARGIREGSEQGKSTPTHGTPSPTGFATLAEVYRICKEVHDREEAERYRRCFKDGPAAELIEKIEELENWRRDMELASAKEEGAATEIARTAAKSTALRTLIISGAVGLFTLLAGKAVDRFWPAHAQAQTVQVQGAQR